MGMKALSRARLLQAGLDSGVPTERGTKRDEETSHCEKDEDLQYPILSGFRRCPMQFRLATFTRTSGMR